MRYSGLILAACLAAALAPAAARADTPDLGRPGAAPKPAARPNYPQSVWRLGEDHGAEHLQSGLVCPREVYTFRAAALQTYDRYGLDVSCGYGDGSSILTIYLTRGGPDLDLGAVYISAKGALLSAGAQRHPVLASEDQPSDGGLAWLRATYGEDAGMRSSLWMAKLRPDWIVQYRATYPADREGTAFAALSKLTRLIEASAGERLKLCAARPAPARTGGVVTDAGELGKLAMMTSILGGAEAAQAQQAKAPADAAPVAWCPETPASANGVPMLFWRGVLADGSDARMDRLTAMTLGPPPELDIGFDSLANLVAEQAAKGAPTPERWTAATRQGAQTWIYGYFDGRPSPATAATLFSDILQGSAKSLGGYRADGKTITINAPPAAKP